MESIAVRGQGKRRRQAAGKRSSGKRASLHGPLEFCMASTRDSMASFETRGFNAEGSHSEANNESSGPAERNVVLADGEQLPEVLAWFRDVCDTDRDAALIFPSSLSKDQRAAIHTLAQAVGLGALASVSKGLGENRHITVVRTGQEDSTSQDQLDDIHRHKAIWIYRWARTSGRRTSRDEIAEMVLQNCLPPDLEQLWEQGRAKQKLVIQLCDLIVESTPDDLKEALGAGGDSYRDVLREGTCDLLAMRAPLHCAARLGKVPQLELLLEAGSPVDSLDGHGWTALQVARQHPEQCEAEGVLLRMGAKDLAPDVPVLLE